MVMTEEEFRRIYQFMKNKYGIDMSQKKEIVNGRLENYVRAGKWNDFGAYMDAVETDITGELEKELVNMMTTNHTYFMREFEHLDYMHNVVLPELRRKEMDKKDLGIWCGASSTGEEPYMLAMLIREFFGLECNQWDTTILATDISTQALKHAIAGRYTGEQIQKIPESWKRRFFRKIGTDDCYEVTEEIKEQVLFRQFNLMEPFPFRRKMHIVYLRNVMIYFDGSTKKQLIKKVCDVMEPGGYLFIGRTETIDREDIPLQMIQPSIFQKTERK